MLTYNFEENTGPLYEFVYNCLKQDIISGVLAPGEKLPSKRSFARNNGVSTITIQNAYDQLVSEGYIYTIEKKGYYVAKLSPIIAPPRQSSVHYDIHIPGRRSYPYDFSGNQINPANFPFSIWARLSREVISGRRDDLMEISQSAGVYELRKAIADHLKSFRGMLVDPDQIVVGAGTEYLYGILVQLLGHDHTYAIENPGYKKLIPIYHQYGVKPVFSDIDEQGLSVDGLASSGAQIAHICPNHHFPTGITMPASRRYEILAWANEQAGRYIIEDDYDSEFRYTGKPIPTLFSIDMCEKVIYMNTFSKSLTPTIRVSYMVLPAHLANKMYEKLSFLSCTVSNFEQYTLAEFMNQGYFEKHINRMRLFYHRQHNRVKEMLETSRLGSRCEIIDNDSGLHFIVKIHTGLPDEVLAGKLEQRGVYMRAVSEYYLTPAKDEGHRFILNYSNVDLDRFAEAMERIYDCLQEDAEKTVSQ